MISGLQHPNLVKLHGCCVEENQLLLVYEYMENNSLAHALFGKDHFLYCVILDWLQITHITTKVAVNFFNQLFKLTTGYEENHLKLDWPTRQRICIGIARGMAHLHEESRLKIVHRDIKAPNILLDKDLTPKISDFGLAKLNEEENTHISTRIAGTMWACHEGPSCYYDLSPVIWFPVLK